jgi:putative tricarboxylic transport membrane protein
MGVVYLFQEIVKQAVPLDLLIMFSATMLGIIIGMLPGLTATMGIALLTTLTFKWNAGSAIMTLIGIYIGAIYGGSRTAILLNIPGTPANAATCLDGYPLARSGKGAEAIGLATTSSFLGSCVGLIALAFFTPVLGNMALEFKSYEIFWLAIFGVAICGNLTASKDHLKGWVAGILGIMLSFVGMDKIQGYTRYTFGIQQLNAGFDIIPVLVGTYGLVEIINNLSMTETKELVTQMGRVIPKLRDLAQNWWNIIRSGLVGVVVGIIPGVGENIASYVAYDMAKRASKKPEMFGKGSKEGLIASETANNACVGGALVPVLSLAIPGSPPAAVLLAALWIHNVRPGPLLMIENPGYIYQFSAMFFWGTLAMLILGLTIVKPMLHILKLRNGMLMPLVFLFCTIGTFAINGRPFDLFVMVFFGLMAFPMRKLGFPDAPFVLGLILGPMIDENMRRGLILSNGSFLPFFKSPISLVLVGLVVLTLFGRSAPVRWVTDGVKGTVKSIFARRA